MVFKSWVFWCFLRLRLTPVTMQRLNPRGSIGNHVLKSIIYKSLGFLFNWWSSLKGSANWIFNSYKAPRGTMTMMVLHSQSPTVKRHPNGPLVPGRFLSSQSDLHCSVPSTSAPHFSTWKRLEKKHKNPKLIQIYSIFHRPFSIFNNDQKLSIHRLNI